MPPSRRASVPPASRLTGRWAGWQFWGGWPDVAWAVLWVLGLLGIVIFARWEAIPYYLIWLCFALLYGFRIRRARPTWWVLATMALTTFAAIGMDVLRARQPASELTEVPLMAAMFWVVMWHADRKLAADTERVQAGEENARQLADQRQFLQDVSHQLRTPITIALGHAELLARSLAGSQDKRDIHVVVGELNRLRRLGERLLLIAASQNPDFLCLEPVALDQLTREALRRWQPAAQRRWQLGQLDQVLVSADRERLRLALDSLLENAVQHTGAGDLIRLSVVCGAAGEPARMVIEDSGAGIPPEALARIFDRFATSPSPDGRPGTGLGLALVSAVMRGHGGEVLVRSTPRRGSTFELLLPAMAAAGGGQPGIPAAALAGRAGQETVTGAVRGKGQEQ